MSADPFWLGIDAALDAIESTKPDTFAAIAAILNDAPDAERGGKLTERHTFFAGSGGDRSLFSALYAAGWRSYWSEARYFWRAEHPTTGERVEYIEGDLYRIEPTE